MLFYNKTQLNNSKETEQYIIANESYFEISFCNKIKA